MRDYRIVIIMLIALTDNGQYINYARFAELVSSS